jgi:glyoxylase-like metal-dependent hydrolase (beta-lactamase superfamily II)
MELTPRIHSIPAAGGVFSGPLAPNVYLVLDGGQGALIDAGYADEGSLEARLGYLRGIPELQLTHIVLTHHHIDHASGAPRLRQATGARVCLHPREDRVLRDWKENAPQDLPLRHPQRRSPHGGPTAPARRSPPCPRRR